MSMNSDGHRSRKRKRGDDNVQKTIFDEQDVDFDDLAASYPDFCEQWSKLKEKKKAMSSATTPAFHIALTRALLHSRFGLVLPSLPDDRLCPPVPNRWAYVQWIQQTLLPLLHSTNAYFETTFSAVSTCRGLDIGTGASCIYPLLMVKSNPNWNMVGSEIDGVSVVSARENVAANGLEKQIQVIAVSPTRAQQGVVTRDPSAPCGRESADSGGPIARALEKRKSDRFDFVMTNPPFFDSDEQLPLRTDHRDRSPMTFHEGMYPGGEEGFVMDMIRDSLQYRDRIGWYSAMCGKKTSFVRLRKLLEHLLSPGHIQTMEFGPGHMTRWFLAWTFRRPLIRSPATQVIGSGDQFEVSVDTSNEKVAALQGVVDRIGAYCNFLPEWHLKYTVNTVRNTKIIEIRETDPAPVTTHVNDDEELPERLTEGIHREWGASTFLPREGHFLVAATVKPIDLESGVGRISVTLTCFRHSKRGTRAVEKIRSQLEGEICRTNRRWRRILRRSAS